MELRGSSSVQNDDDGLVLLDRAIEALQEFREKYSRNVMTDEMRLGAIKAVQVLFTSSPTSIEPITRRSRPEAAVVPAVNKRNSRQAEPEVVHQEPPKRRGRVPKAKTPVNTVEPISSLSFEDSLKSMTFKGSFKHQPIDSVIASVLSQKEFLGGLRITELTKVIEDKQLWSMKGVPIDHAVQEALHKMRQAKQVYKDQEDHRYRLSSMSPPSLATGS